MNRGNLFIGVLCSAMIAATTILYGLGAAYHTDSPAEAHVLYHWGAGVASGLLALIVIVFLFWPAYVWGVERRTRWIARLPGGPTIKLPFAGRLRHRMTGRLEIVSAKYGRDDHPNRWVDVTKEIRDLLTNDKLHVTVSNTLFPYPDPLPNLVKDLVVTFKLGGREIETRATEGFDLDLP